MGIFDVFSDSAGKNAAGQQNKSLQDAYNMANQRLDQYASQERDELHQGKQEALGYLDAGVSQAQPWLEKSITPFQGLYDRGTQGIDYYGQLVGLGGGDQAAIQQTLEGIPGYQFTLNQGLEALNRRRNAAGMLNSGNADIDAMTYGQGLAGQNYFDYLNALNPYFGMAQGAASGLAGGFGGIANLYSQLAANKSNVTTGTASQTADSLRNQGSGNMNLALGRGQAEADMYANQYAAGQAANQNLWSAILSGLTAGVGAI